MKNEAIRRSGMLISLCGFALLSCGDAVVKTIAGQWPGLAVAALRFSLAAVVLGGIVYRREGVAGLRVPLPRVQLLRGLGLAVATMSFFSAIYLMPLATATIIAFVSPIITAIISAIFLRERAAMSTWVTAVVAFIGVALVLQPDIRHFDVAMLLPVLAAVGTSMLMIGNRLAVGSGSILKMQYMVALFALPFLMVGAITGHVFGDASMHVTLPAWTVVARIMLVAVTATLSHYLIYLGVMRAGANDAAPMTYVQALVTLAIGVLAFGDWPNLLALVGAAIVIGAGYWQLRSGARQPSGE